MYVSVNLRNNKDVILAAVSNNGYAIIYASTKLQNDIIVLIMAFYNLIIKDDMENILYIFKTERLDKIRLFINNINTKIIQSTNKILDDNQGIVNEFVKEKEIDINFIICFLNYNGEETSVTRDIIKTIDAFYLVLKCRNVIL